MRRKTEAETERAALLKTVRSLTRLRHSLAADKALNELLPVYLAEFDEAAARGELKSAEDALDDFLEP